MKFWKCSPRILFQLLKC